MTAPRPDANGRLDAECPVHKYGINTADNPLGRALLAHFKKTHKRCNPAPTKGETA
jgi:hypothetical protein